MTASLVLRLAKTRSQQSQSYKDVSAIAEAGINLLEARPRMGSLAQRTFVRDLLLDFEQHSARRLTCPDAKPKSLDHCWGLDCRPNNRCREGKRHQRGNDRDAE